MAPATLPAHATVTVHRLSVEDVFAMTAAGIFEENARVELVQGVLVDMQPIGPQHEGAVEWLIRHFASVADAPWRVRVQSMLLVEGGYLLPDLSVIEPLTRTQLPETALLVIEVAQTSQLRDRDKARDYAAADVPEYWVVDLAGREVIVHRGPLAGAYEDVTTYRDGESITPVRIEAPAVAVTELLG